LGGGLGAGSFDFHEWCPLRGVVSKDPTHDGKAVMNGAPGL
jgi:hypothetical protein